MKIRVLMGFEGYERGQVFEDWPAGMCEGLIAMGAIEEVKDDPPPERPADAASAARPGPAGKKRG